MSFTIPFYAIDDGEESLWKPDEPTMFDAILHVRENLNSIHSINFNKLGPLTEGEKMVISMIDRRKELRKELTKLWTKIAQAQNLRATSVLEDLRKQAAVLEKELLEIEGTKNPNLKLIVGYRSEVIRPEKHEVVNDVVCQCLACPKPIKKGQQVVKYADHGLCCNFKCLSYYMVWLSEEKSHGDRRGQAIHP